MKRQRFKDAFRAELREWRRLTSDEEALLRIFCACVALRMKGKTIDSVLSSTAEEGAK